MSPFWTWVGFAIGALGVIGPAVGWAIGRRRRRAQNLAIDRLIDEAAAAEARSDAGRYEQLRAVLREQVEHTIPREARRAYLANRADQLATSLARDFLEYETVRAEIGDLSEARGLDDRIRTVIRETLVPPVVAARRRERILLSLVGLLVVVSATPAANFLPRYFNTALDTPRVGWASELISSGASLVVVLAVAARFLLFAHRASPLTPLTRRQRAMQTRGMALLALLAGAAFIGCVERYAYNANYSAVFGNPSPPPLEMAVIGIVLAVAPLVLGVALGGLIASVQRRVLLARVLRGGSALTTDSATAQSATSPARPSY